MNENTALVNRAFREVWNEGNYTNLNQYVASDMIIHSSLQGEEIRGPAGVKQFYTSLRAAFPDIHFVVEDQLVQGDRVVTRWTARATHKGEYRGVPPTGKQITMTGIDIDRIVNGKVVEYWPITDELSLLRQLDALPAPVQVGH